MEGDYLILYSVNFKKYPNTKAKSEEPFVITVIDPCKNLANLVTD